MPTSPVAGRWKNRLSSVGVETLLAASAMKDGRYGFAKFGMIQHVVASKRSSIFSRL